MSALVRWRSPVPLHHAQREFELPAELASVLEALLAAAPLPAGGGDPQRWRQASVQVATLVRLYGARTARARARDQSLRADDGLLPASAEHRGELESVETYLRSSLEREAAWAVLYEDCGRCAVEHVALAGGLPAARVCELVDEERRRGS